MHASRVDSQGQTQREGLRGMPEDGRLVGPPASVPELRARRLLRLVQEQARHDTLPRDSTSHRSVPRAGRGLALVLRGRGLRLTTARRKLLESRAIALPLSALVWAAYVLIVIGWVPIVAAYRLATFRRDANRMRVGRVLRRAGALAVAINPFWDFRVVDGFDAGVSPDPRRAHLFVANHRS